MKSFLYTSIFVVFCSLLTLNLAFAQQKSGKVKEAIEENKEVQDEIKEMQKGIQEKRKAYRKEKQEERMAPVKEAIKKAKRNATKNGNR